MRRSTNMMIVIMLAGFGGLLLAANTLVKPLAHDVQTAKELTRLLVTRGDVAQGTDVRAVRLPASERRLASSGRGLVVDLTPSPQVLAQEGALAGLAARVAVEGMSLYREADLDWIEIAFHLPPDAAGVEPEPLRTLVAWDERGALREPTPALPARLGPPPSPSPAAPPAPGAPPSTAGG